MNRITIKTTEGIGYSANLHNINLKTKDNPKGIDYIRLSELVVKCGKFEDLMDKYNVENMEELEERLKD